MTLPKLTLQEAIENSREHIQNLKNQQQIFDSDLSELIQSETELLEELEDRLKQQQQMNQKKE